MNYILLICFQRSYLLTLKKTEVELEIFTDAEMLLIVGKSIRGGICHAVHKCVKAGNTYVKGHDPSTE